MSTLFAFLHHTAAFVLFSALVVEFVTIKDAITARSAQRLLRADAVLGLAAMLVLGVGILRVVWFDKGLDYYLHSVPFLVKFTLFVLTALLSIYPTRRFMAWRTAVRQGQPPVVDAAVLRTIRQVIHVEMAAVGVILLMAAMMARGVAMFE
jgi:putative membrane protein